MKLIIKKPHNYFWATALLTILVGYIIFTKINHPALDFNFNDTYYVISNFDITILISYALAFIGLIYYLHSKFDIPLFKFLTNVHTLITIGCVILYFFSPLFHFENDNDFPLFDEDTYFDNFLISVLIIGLCVQLVFVFNSIIGLIRHFTGNIKKL